MICLSFDTDHIDESRMRQFLDEVAIPGAATFFCTQTYECLDEPHERCPHPVLLDQSNWEHQLTVSREIAPGAVGWRSHSCTYSHRLGLTLAAAGYEYASTQMHPTRCPQPFREAWGLWQVPIFYMDNVDFSLSRFWPMVEHEPFAPRVIEAALADPRSLFVFDFHPIHLLLNSESAAAYLERRDAFLAGDPLPGLRCAGRGARTFYDQLCAAMNTAGVPSFTIREGLRTWCLDAAVHQGG